jgi:dihydrofolate reductase
MSKVVVDISMSLDGFVTGPGADVEHGLGIGGEPLHRWVFDESTEADRKALEQATAHSGAVLMGRRLFDVIDGPHGWTDEVGYRGDGDQSNPPPYFVVSHSEPESIRLKADFTFVADIPSAVEQAKAAAGDQDVLVMGGGELCCRCIAEGVVDEVRIHLAPILLGGGTPLFAHLGADPIELEVIDVVDTPHATHLTYRIAGR